MIFILSALLAGAITVVLIALALGNRERLPLDYPNARSLHRSPVPRIGGVAIMCGVLIGSITAHLLANMDLPFLILIIALALAAVSFADDWRGLAVHWRFLAHFLAAGLFVYLSLASLPYWLAGLLLVAVVWMTNLYNFMDGVDGLAGGMALFGFSTYAIAAWVAGDAGLAMLSFLIAAAALGFLFFNFNMARAFMGDAGSIPLGFLSAALGLVGWARGHWPLWFPLLVFSPFVVDASATLIRRALRGENVWRAHKTHYYQRLVQLGWGHRRTVLWEYGLMLACATSALWVVNRPPAMQFAAIGMWTAIYALLAMYVSTLEKKQLRRLR